MSTSRPTVFFLALVIMSLCVFPTIVSSQSAAAASIPPYGNCAPPQSAGVQICAPLTSGNATIIGTPFQLIAYGTGARAPVANMQVWVDGAKVNQATGNVFDAPV